MKKPSSKKKRDESGGGVSFAFPAAFFFLDPIFFLYPPESVPFLFEQKCTTLTDVACLALRTNLSA